MTVAAHVRNEDLRQTVTGRGRRAQQSPDWPLPGHLLAARDVIIRYGHGGLKAARDLFADPAVAPALRRAAERSRRSARHDEAQHAARRLADLDTLLMVGKGMVEELCDQIADEWRSEPWLGWFEGGRDATSSGHGDLAWNDPRRAWPSDGTLVELDDLQRNLHDPQVGAQRGNWFKTARRHTLPDGRSIPIWRYGRADRPCATPCGEEVTCEDCGTGDYLAYLNATEQAREAQRNLPSPHTLRVGQRVRVLTIEGLTWPAHEAEGVITELRGEPGPNQGVTVKLDTAPVRNYTHSPYARYVKALEP